MVEGFLFYLLGWMIFSTGYYFIADRKYHTKGYHVYEGIKYGCFSWFGIVTFIVVHIIVVIATIDERIKNKLDN